MPLRKQESVLAYNFALELRDGPLGEKSKTAYFREISGLGVDYDVVEHKTVDAQGRPIVQKIPGRISYGAITLKRGITADLSLWEWHRVILEETVEKARTTVLIRLFDASYRELFHWTLARAWPSKISGPQLTAESNDIAVEELTIVYESFVRENAGAN